MQELKIRTPDDWHCHLRDGAYLERTVNDTARQFARAIVMPNLIPAITSVALAQQYRERILKALTQDRVFEPLMTLYLTEQLSTDTLIEAKQCGFIKACKLYPAGATTNSAAGVTSLERIYPLLDTMQQQGLVLCIHGESIRPGCDIFEREQQFIDESLQPIVRHFPRLRVVLEHISTRYAVEYVQQAPANVAATITAHHLWFNRNDLLQGGIKPHYYCLPILKHERDRQALVQAAISGNPKFFLGTDSAPHAVDKKIAPCGCAGIYTAYSAMELYAEIFAANNALDKLHHFASRFGAEFYQQPINDTELILRHQSWTVPQNLSFGEHLVSPMLAGETLQWRVVDE